MALEEGRSLELTQDLLKGAIDMHVHAGPHLTSSPRRLDPIEAAMDARDNGMRAMVLIDVFNMSNGVAWLVNRHVPGFKTYGGLAMNTNYGGMNPRAWKTAIHYGEGAKYLMFGTHSTYYQASKEGRMVDGKFTSLADIYPKFRKEELDRSIRIPINEEPGEELDEILKLLADNPHIYMDTGHVSVEEAVRLVELRKKYGYKKIIISSSVTKITPVEVLKNLAKQGAFIEFTFGSYTAAQMVPLTHYYVEKEYASIDEGMSEGGGHTIRTVAEQIKEIGASHCIMSTDFGRYGLATPVEGLRQFIACMLDLGLSVDEVRQMVKTNPEYILGLDPL
jgi:hypothetical protein